MRIEYEISNKDVINSILTNKDKMLLVDAIEEAKKRKTLQRKDIDGGWKTGFRKYATIFKEEDKEYVKFKSTD